MDLRKLKIGTLLTLGIVAIIGLMISSTIYSSYLSNNAQKIIESSTSRIFDVLTIQRDVEELFSAINNLERIQGKEGLSSASQKIKSLSERAQNTIRTGRERQIFSENDSLKANEVLRKVSIMAENIIRLKSESTSINFDQNNDQNKNYNSFSKVDMELNNVRNIRFEMLGVINSIISRSDEEFRGAMDLVGRAQIVTWIVVGFSSVLAAALAFFLVRSAKKIYEIKNEFINIIAHDLRNPVVAIIGGLDLISTEKDKSAVKLKEYIQAIEVSAQKLRTQINNLLEVGRTEAGHTKLNLEPVHAAKVIKESVLRAKALAQISGIKIEDGKINGNDAYVLADKSKLSDVLDNLISNAIKYNNEKGTVTISTQDGEKMFSISVADTGAGIPEDQKEKIFKKYSRLDTDAEKQVSGTGLGLYTVKLSMDKMDGTVSFETEQGKGTTFTVSLKKVNKPED